MKVLMLATHLNVGGVTGYMLRLCEGLAARGIECRVCSSGGNAEKYFTGSGIGTFTLGIRTKFEFHPRLIPAAFRLVRYVRENRIDVIHAHTRVAQVIASVVSRLTGTIFVSTCHGFFEPKRLSRRLLPCFGDGVIAISDAVKRHLTDDFRVSGDRISVVYTGVDAGKFGSGASEEDKKSLLGGLGIHEGPVLGSIGRLSPVKGYRFLLQAMVSVREVYPAASLLLIGEGPEEESLKNMAQDLGLADCVFFLNTRVDTARFYPLFDVFILPSVQEGLGIALLEAMAAGRVCVASSVGGITDVIEEGVNGILVAPADPGLLAVAVARALGDRASAAKIGARARETIETKFTLDGMISGTVKFYERFLHEKKK
ncbi:MAG: glycosyltransferase family 4 protein [Candidatus Omnitrophota bacterium]